LWRYSATALSNTIIFTLILEAEFVEVRLCLDEVFGSDRRTICEVTGINGELESWYQFSFGSPHASDLHELVGLTTTTTTTLVIREISESKHAEASLRSSGEQLRDFAARLEAVREEERTRVAAEIHDELGQALTVLKLD